MIKSYFRSYVLTFVALFVVLFGGLNAALASAASNGAANGFTVSPVLSEITVNKGSSQTVPVTVSNPTSTSLVAQPIVNDFSAALDGTGTPNLILKDNVKLPSNNFKSLVGNIPTTTLGPNETQIINVTITVPKNTNSGGYYGAIRFIPGNTGSTSNVGLTASVGTLFLVTVPGNLTTSLSINQLSAADVNGNASSFFTNGQISTLLRLSNTGNIHTQPYGTIELKNMWGHVLSITQFNSTKANILPDSTRKFLVSMPQRSYLGRYTITASIANGTSSSNLVVATSSFWYIPIWAQIVTVIVIILIVALVYWIVHSIRSRKFSKK